MDVNFATPVATVTRRSGRLTWPRKRKQILDEGCGARISRSPTWQLTEVHKSNWASQLKQTSCVDQNSSRQSLPADVHNISWQRIPFEQ